MSSRSLVVVLGTQVNKTFKSLTPALSKSVNVSSSLFFPLGSPSHTISTTIDIYTGNVMRTKTIGLKKAELCGSHTDHLFEYFYTIIANACDAMYAIIITMII